MAARVARPAGRAMISVTDALISEMTDLRMSQTKVLEVLDIVYDARDGNPAKVRGCHVAFRRSGFPSSLRQRPLI